MSTPAQMLAEAAKGMGNTEIVAPTRRRSVMKRFPMPPGCDIEAIVIRELRNKDRLEASFWAEKNATDDQKKSVASMIESENMEAVRLAIVAVQEDGVMRRVDNTGMPFKDLDQYSYRTMAAIQNYFSDLNGISQEELKNAQAGAQMVTEAELLEATVTPARPSVSSDSASES